MRQQDKSKISSYFINFTETSLKGGVQMDIFEEEALIKRIKKGDTEAFDQLVRNYEKKVYNTALRYCKNPDDAFDISQDVFLRVYRYIYDFKGESTFSTWIYRITVNLCTDYIRKGQNNKTIPLYAGDEDDEYELPLPDDAPTPEERYETKEKIEYLKKAIDSLPDDHREIIVMRDINGLQYEEIARALEINIGTVKSRISRARDKLKSILEQNGNFFDIPKSNS
jgi:RNA polymerase sigma-70 factor (ECF subfamily)